MTEVDALAKQADPDVLVVAVGTGERDRIERIRADDALTVRIPAATEAWTAAMGVTAFPETLLVDPQGRVAERIRHGLTLADLEQRVDWLRAEARGEPLAYHPDRGGHPVTARAIYGVERLVRRDRAEDPFRWRVRSTPGQIELVLDVPRGHHVFADQVDVEVLDPAGLAIGTPTLSPGTPVDDPDEGPRVRYDHDLTLTLPVSGPTDRRTVTLALREQGCRADTCFPPRTTQRSVEAAGS